MTNEIIKHNNGDPGAEVVIVRDENNNAREVLIIRGDSINLDSPNLAATLEIARKLTKEYKQKYGPGTNFVFINSEGYKELLRGESPSGLGEFIKGINFSSIPKKIIRVVHE